MSDNYGITIVFSEELGVSIDEIDQARVELQKEIQIRPNRTAFIRMCVAKEVKRLLQSS